MSLSSRAMPDLPNDAYTRREDAITFAELGISLSLSDIYYDLDFA